MRYQNPSVFSESESNGGPRTHTAHFTRTLTGVREDSNNDRSTVKYTFLSPVTTFSLSFGILKPLLGRARWTVCVCVCVRVCGHVFLVM